MKAYIILQSTIISDYGKDAEQASFALVLPKERIKVPYSPLHFAMSEAGNESAFSLANNIRKFTKHDLGLNKLEDLSPEEWVKYMESEGGLRGYKYSCIPIQLEKGLVEKLNRKIQADKENKKLDNELKYLLLDKAVYSNSPTQ
jgi:hypothetical protein